jgi:hypothetical protein
MNGGTGVGLVERLEPVWKFEICNALVGDVAKLKPGKVRPSKNG